MIDKIKELMKKYEEIIVYLIVGVLTTIFSWAACFVAEVLGLDPASDAARKGIQTDDILMSINGTRILSMDDLNNVLYGCEVGDIVEAVIYRAGKQYLVSLTVAEAKGS